MTRNPDILEVIQLLNRVQEDSLFVCTVAEVVRYRSEERSVDVQPLIRRKLQDGSHESWPVLHRCPVVFPGGGAVDITWPLEVGDEVIVIHADRSIDEWKQRGGEQSPLSGRLHALSDAFVIPAVQPTARAEEGVTDRLSVRYGDVLLELDAGKVVITADDIRLGSASASDPVVRQSDLQAALDDVWATYGAHTHTAPGGTTGTPTTLTPTTGSEWSAQGSNKVTAE